MLHPPAAAFDEQHRLEALHALELLDTAPDAVFDALAALAARLLDCPVGLVSLLDEQRLFVRASVGLSGSEFPRYDSFCEHTIRSDDPMIVEDLRADPRFRENAYVCGNDGFRFYAGAPIHARHPTTGESHRVGAICALDRVGRGADARQQAALAHLGTVAEALLAARAVSLQAVSTAVSATAQAVALKRSDLTFRQAERIAAIGSWRYELASGTLDWSEGVGRIHELPAGVIPSLEEALDFYPGDVRDQVAATFGRAVETGAPFDFETDFVTARGNLRRVRSMGEAELDSGVVMAVTGVFQDVTERHCLEQELRRSADTDGLTGVANRVAFDRALEAAMAASARDGSALTLVLVDLDKFKQLNDRLGHAAGDDVLRATGQRLRAGWLAGSVAARLGGDEFGLILRDPALAASGEASVARLLAELHEPVAGAEGVLPSAATIGFASFDPAAHATVRAFLHSADCALYEAKRAGRGTARRFVRAGRRADDRVGMATA